MSGFLKLQCWGERRINRRKKEKESKNKPGEREREREREREKKIEPTKS